MSDDVSYYWRKFNLKCVQLAKVHQINRELRKELLKSRRELMRIKSLDQKKEKTDEM